VSLGRNFDVSASKSVRDVSVRGYGRLPPPRAFPVKYANDYVHYAEQQL